MSFGFDQTTLPVDEGMPRSTNVPTGTIEQGLLSDTSVAADCFIDQRFSNKLQAYLIGYVNSIYSNYSIYK